MLLALSCGSEDTHRCLRLAARGSLLEACSWHMQPGALVAQAQRTLARCAARAEPAVLYCSPIHLPLLHDGAVHVQQRLVLSHNRLQGTSDFKQCLSTCVCEALLWCSLTALNVCGQVGKADTGAIHWVLQAHKLLTRQCNWSCAANMAARTPSCMTQLTASACLDVSGQAGGESLARPIDVAIPSTSVQLDCSGSSSAQSQSQ